MIPIGVGRRFLHTTQRVVTGVWPFLLHLTLKNMADSKGTGHFMAFWLEGDLREKWLKLSAEAQSSNRK